MKHTIRKYISNRGSALFMVLSTMTALMISCMAMYFSVVSSRSTQYAIFYQQQSYQSAVSLSDALIASIWNKTDASTDLTTAMSGMDVGDKISTQSNGFKAFATDGVGNDDDGQLGSYMIEITRLADEKIDGNTVKQFDIIVTSSVNGTKEVYHNLISWEDEKEVKNIQPFTSTGYTPDDPQMSGGIIYGDLFYDNEVTVLKAYQDKSMIVHQNLYCGGSLYLNYYVKPKGDKPQTFAIRGDFTMVHNHPIDFQKFTGTSEQNIVMVGGNLSMSKWTNINNADVYVLGDLILDNISLSNTSNFFVNGDVILKSNDSNVSNLYCNGKVIYEYEGGTEKLTKGGTWSAKASGLDKNGFLTVSEMITSLNEKTTTETYYKWAVQSQTDEEIIKFSTDINDPKPTAYLAYSESSKGCVIKDIQMYAPNNGGPNNLTLIIDTGDDPDNVYTIEVKANRDYLYNDGKNDTFCWYPYNTYNSSSSWQNNTNVPFQVLVMGRGSVVIHVPDNVIYQDDDRFVFMHYGFFLLNGGETKFIGAESDKATKRSTIENTEYIRKNDIIDTFYQQFIHYDCHDGDGCSYTEYEIDRYCPQCKKKGNKVKILAVECPNHGRVMTYCPECESLPEGDLCKCFIDYPSVDKYLASHSSIKSKMLDSSGKVIYPTVNIFIVSNDENADIRLSSYATDDPEVLPASYMNNSFFGCVYAPYMTFKAGPSNSGGGWIRILGSLTVSNYIIDDSYAMLAVKPTRMPNDIMPESSFDNILEGLVNKSWKINLNAHG